MQYKIYCWHFLSPMQHKLEIGPYKCQPVSRFDILCNEYSLEADCIPLHVHISTKYDSMKILQNNEYEYWQMLQVDRAYWIDIVWSKYFPYITIFLFHHFIFHFICNFMIVCLDKKPIGWHFKFEIPESKP